MPNQPPGTTAIGQTQIKHQKKKKSGTDLELETVDVDTDKVKDVLDEIEELLEDTAEYQQNCGCGW